MRYLTRIIILTIIIAINFLPPCLGAEFLRQNLRVGFDDTAGNFWQGSRLLYHGAAYELTEYMGTYMSVHVNYTRGTLADNLLRLHSGSLDFVYLPENGQPTNPSKGPTDLPPNTIFVPLGQGFGWLLADEYRTDLKERALQAMAEIKEVNPLFPNSLLEKYHVKGHALNLTPEEKAYLAAHPVIRTMVSPRQPPYTYFEKGEAKGIIADIIKRLEADLGITLEIIPEETQHTMMQHLTNGDIDMVMDFYTDHNWAKAHNAILTFPYLTLNYVSVMRKDRPLPETPTVACARTHFYTHDFIERTFPPEQLRYYADVPDCMAAVNRGEADMTFVKSVTAQSDIYRGSYYNLYTNGNVVFSHKVSIAISDTADPLLLKILNKEVAHIDPQDIASIVNSQVYGVQAQDTLKAFIYRNPFMSLCLLGGVLSIIIIGLLYFMQLRRKYTAELWRQANVVTITDIYNLHWFAQELPNAIAYYQEARKNGELFVLVVSAQRVAFLKELHGTQTYADCIERSLQELTKKHPWILRYGLSAEITHVYMLCQKPPGLTLRQSAEQIEKAIRIIPVNGIPTTVTYHIGLCPVPRNGDIDASLLMDNAMMARNEIIGKSNTIGIFNTNMHDEMLKHQQMELYMEKALETGEFQIHLQAKYDLNTRKICGAEALVRWQSPELGFLMPNHFIPLFERNGFAIRLDYYVLELVCKCLQERLKKKLPVVPISVNQSGLHISERGYLASIQAIADCYKLPRKLVELELTETSFIDFNTKTENENALQITRRLKSMGFALSMDDFCTGYSSIAMLRNLPMDIMKIDRSMLLSAEQDERALTILKQVIQLGQNLSMRVLVEGIETEAQERLLKATGCHIGQGFLFAHPVPIEQFFAKLDNSLKP
ncbi:periplasmic sensor diguanylate cyclase/phosphodiesterase [Selenomonas ruminantium]|uniref:Periplasmic sensor diguanylate cyclase/phosphodiesterase n=1 Tax=Selenomonas ruminantium TaxID=971 RepID=A0A1M6WEI0_SELRU|nr:EAL domain-containing protein [Selenomonas ruminantium]SHK91875.1 periplasmic sensor diguanylate cyclase/phosphodiesterase [Selenomonas ruminantium]